METAMKPVQNGRGRKRRWPAEQKLAVFCLAPSGTPIACLRTVSQLDVTPERWKELWDQAQ